MNKDVVEFMSSLVSIMQFSSIQFSSINIELQHVLSLIP